ncbi:MAG: ADP-dependent NAD(P)H-hydrate dehydratase / NAD(P)H-hydrate epimerase, partial [Caballeronia sp.]|nr:ADP-dependent NAD(P)H-hydrate dehydratase / NAD(P)H-hydrate epimerase [Caballeronia sp.]
MTHSSLSNTPTPPYVEPCDHALALLTSGELRTLESRAAASLPANTLMARAGAAAAQFVIDQSRYAPHLAAVPVWIVAGPGNNGGDALVMAARLRQAGIDVEVCMPVEVKPDDARWALAEARQAGVKITTEAPPSFDHLGWLVDGMFGIGLGRPLEGVFADLAARLSRRSKASGGVLALDIASGLSSDTGEPVSRSADGRAQAVRATHTITFIGAKPGHFTGDGRDLTGKLYIADLGVKPPLEPSVVLNAPSLFGSHLPSRDYATNKGTFGTLAVLGGDTGMCGAPILAARMALYGGAGKVNVAFIGTDSPPYDPPHPELMLHHVDQISLDKMNALAVGCGMGQSERARK